MQVISKIITLKNTGAFSTESIEKELIRLNINPLRWAIVDIKKDELIVNVAHLETI